MAWASKNRKKLNRVSKAEALVAQMLKADQVFFHQNWGFQTKGGGYRFVDFFIRKSKLIIEIDGPEHNAENDAIREKEILLTFAKYKFVRFTNDEVFNDPETVREIIRQSVRCLNGYFTDVKLNENK